MLDAAGLADRVGAELCGPRRASATRRVPPRRPAPSRARDRQRRYRPPGKPRATERLGAGPAGAASRGRTASDWPARASGRGSSGEGRAQRVRCPETPGPDPGGAKRTEGGKGPRPAGVRGAFWKGSGWPAMFEPGKSSGVPGGTTFLLRGLSQSQ